MNFMLFITEIIITIIFLIISYKKNKHEGLYIYTIILYILSIITSVKNIEIMTMDIPLGIILTTMIYFINNILVQEKGLEPTKKITPILLIIGIATISIITLTASLIPIDNTTFINTYNLLFINKLRVAIIIAMCPIIIININSVFYYQLKREKNKILINNILSALIMFFIEASIFSLLTFVSVIPISDIFVTIAIIYVIKITTGIITIPISYIMQKTNKK